MTAEAVSAAAQPGAARSPVGLHSPDASAAGPPTAASAHLRERTLTRCAMTRWSPTW
jgi:hypothetical protein